MNNSFYRAFEERYRGSRKLILERLRVYKQFVLPLMTLHQPARALDLGCGRGEWLELLGEAGFDASGVDLDDSMLAACRERGLKTSRADALATLHNLPDASISLVSAFHLVEHIPFDDVRALIAQALRVLQPGGLLIMETPNPENLVVGTSDFYNDPSHLRPIPPKLLVFATEHAGFARQRIMRLQEAPALVGANVISLFDVLGGASPDFSVVAQKSATAAELAQFDAAFEGEHGIDVYTLAQRFDIGRYEQLQETQARLAQLADRVSHQTASVAHEAAQALLGLGQLQQAHQALAIQVQAATRWNGAPDRRLAVAEPGQTEENGPEIPQRRAVKEDSVMTVRKQIEYIEARLNVEHAQRQEAMAAFALDAGVLQDRLEARLTAAEERSHAGLPNVPALLEHSARVDALVRRMEQRLAAAESHTAQLLARIEQAESESRHTSQRVLDMLASRSWRLTAPLRVISGGAIRLRGAMRRRDDLYPGNGAAAHPEPVRRSFAGRLVRAALRRLPFRHAGTLVKRFPWLHARLHRLMFPASDVVAHPATPAAEAAVSVAPADQQPPGGDLSPRALQIYRRLKRFQQNGMN